jgi:hypothetical protein
MHKDSESCYRIGLGLLHAHAGRCGSLSASRGCADHGNSLMWGRLKWSTLRSAQGYTWGHTAMWLCVGPSRAVLMCRLGGRVHPLECGWNTRLSRRPRHTHHVVGTGNVCTADPYRPLSNTVQLVQSWLFDALVRYCCGAAAAKQGRERN